MAIGARVAPEMIVFGECSGIRTNEWEGDYRGKRVTVETDGGPLVVNYRKEDDTAVPLLGEFTAVVVSAFDGARGASLSYERPLTHSDLDLIATKALGAPVAG